MLPLVQFSDVGEVAKSDLAKSKNDLMRSTTNEQPPPSSLKNSLDWPEGTAGAA